MAVTESFEHRNEIQFDAIIHRALSNENKNYLRDTGRRLKKQALFSELDDEFVAGFADQTVQDAFDEIDSEFCVLDFPIAIRDSFLHHALSQLDDVRRNIILMAYWLDMNDKDISETTGIKRRTVNYKRNETYAILREILEADGYATGNNITDK